MGGGAERDGMDVVVDGERKCKYIYMGVKI